MGHNRAGPDHRAASDADRPNNDRMGTHLNPVLQNRTASAWMPIPNSDAMAQDDIVSEHGVWVHHEAITVKDAQSRPDLEPGGQFKMSEPEKEQTIED